MTIKARLFGSAAGILFAASPLDAQQLPPEATGPQSTQAPPVSDAPARQEDQSLAPTDIDTGIGDIIITATRTGETRAQATPLAITVLGADRLNASLVTNVKDLVQLAPGLNVAQVTASAAIYIRGVGSNNVFGGSDPDVTVQSDGVYISRAFGQFQDYIDVARIEVLRGPQGTLYGRNAVGGTINIISRLPTDEFAAKAQLTVGNYNLIQQQTFISGPLVPGRLAASLSSNYIYHDDYFDNIVPDRDGTANANRGGVRGQLRFTPDDRVEAIVRADYNRAKEHVDTYSQLLVPVPFAPLATSIIGDYRRIAMDQNDRSDVELWGVSGELNVALTDALDFKSLTAFRRSQYDVTVDQDDTDAPAGISRQQELSRQFSQEFNLTLRLPRFVSVGGLYYFRDHQSTDLQSFNPPSGRTPAAASSNTVFAPESYARSLAAFAQGTYNLTDALSVIAGLRYTSDCKRIAQNVTRTSLNPARLGVSLPGFPFVADRTRDYDALTPKIGVNYQLADDVLAYMSATRGFKSGGTSFSATNVPSLSFGPETIWSYEAGLKSDFLDRRLRVNLSAFRYDYSDLQVQSLLGVGVLAIGNAASARINGFEIETTARPTPNLLFTVNYSLLDTKYNRFPNSAVPGTLIPFVSANPRYDPVTRTFDASGNRLNAAPHDSVQATAQYSVPGVLGGKAFVRGEYYYQSATFYDPTNAAITRQPAYSLFNASVGVNWDSGWATQVVAKNLTDKEYLITIAANGAAPSGLAGAPRTVALQVTKSW